MSESRRLLCRMRLKFKSIYELMDYTAQLFDFSPEQRREFFKLLEEKNILKTSQDPVKEATKLAKKIAGKARRGKAAQAGATGVPRSTPRRPPLDEDEEDEIEDYGGYTYDVDSDTPEEES
jgi:hypothetical protein